MTRHEPSAAEKIVAERLRKKGHDHAAKVVEQGKGATGSIQRQIQKAAEEEGIDTGWVR